MTKSILSFTADDVPEISGVADGNLFDSLLWQESRGRQTDANGAPVTSRKGAIGIAQVMPNTAPEAAALAGLPFDDIKYRTDLEYNKAIGRAYFNKQLADFGDPAKALGAYNAGPGAMRRALAAAEKAGNPDAWIQYLPAETQAYIPSILKKAGSTGAAPAAGQDYYKPNTTQYATLPPPAPPRSAFEAAADAALALGSGVVAGAGLIANAAGADNAVARTLDETAKSIDSMSSPSRKAQVAARGETIRQAEATGDTWEEIKAYGGAFLEAPIETVLNAVGTSAPTLLMGFIPGLGQAQAARLIAQGAVGASQGAGSVKGAIYDAVARKLTDDGMHPDEAKKVAAGAQAYDGVNGGNIAVGAILGIAAGTTGAEATIARIASGGVARAGGQSIGKRVAIGVGKESPVEFAQDAQERGSSNVALQNEGFDVPTMQGVIGQGTLAALASAPMGAVAGALDRNVPPALAPVADAADKPDSPLSRAAMAGNTGPAADAARAKAAASGQATVDPAARLAELEAISKGTPNITSTEGVTTAGTPGRFFTAEEQAEYKDLKARQATSTEASGADPLSEKAGRISDAIREKGALDALRSEDAPVDVQEVLKDLAIAQSKSTPAARREQALNRLEFALAWAGIHPAEKVAPLGIKLDANGVPTGSPADINLADRRAAIDAATAPRAPAPQPEGQTYDSTQAAERAAAADKELQQDNVKAAAKPAPLPPADAVMAALKVIPALRTAEQTALVKQAEARYSPADMRVLEMGANYQAGMSATDKIQLERLRGVESPGLAGPAKPAVIAPAPSAPAPVAPANEQISAPVVATPTGAGPAVLRKRRAVLAQVVDLGLSRVERRGEEYFLTNGKKDFKLEGAADAQLARKAVQDAIRIGAEQANTEQTAAQALAGNYKKGRVEFDGLKLGIENPVGSERKDKANVPPKWTTKMDLAHYGDVTGTTGADGDGVDVYLADNPRAGSPVFVIDQYKGDTFDETKSILGVATEAEALRIYDAGFSDGSGPSRRRGVTKMTVEEFKKWAFSAAAEKPAGSENGKTGSAADGAGDQGAGKQLPDIAGSVASGGPGKVRPDGTDGNAAAGQPDAGGKKSAPAGDGGRGSNVTVQVEGKPVTVQTVSADELAAESSTREGRPGRKLTKQNAELLQRLATMFGKEVVFFKDPLGEIGDGFVEPGRDGTIFLNESSGISPLAVFGHELLHQIEQSHPEIQAAIKKVVVAHLGENAPHQFRNDYHGRKQGPNSNAPLNEADVNEIVSDLGGNLLSDGKFWREVFEQIETENPGKAKSLIAKLADLFYAMVDRLIKSIQQPGFRATEFITDMKDVRAAFREGLAKYIADAGITRTAMQAEILRAGQDAKRSTDRDPLNRIKDFARQQGVNIDVEMQGEDDINLNFIESTGSAKRGAGGQVLEKLIEFADANEKYIRLSALNQGLRNWYERFGFEADMGYGELEEDILMIREPDGNASLSKKRESTTNTPEFKEWFGDSQVVDGSGKPMVVYHGTGADFSEFRPAKRGIYGTGIYLSASPGEASEYAYGATNNDADGANVIPVYASLQNPYIFKTENGKGIATTEALVKEVLSGADRIRTLEKFRGVDGAIGDNVRDALMELGHDGLIVNSTWEPTEYIAFMPEQVKSATGNNGDFDSNSADITRSPEREMPTTGIHFSKEPRKRLDGAYYGRGMKGAEAKRLQNTDDQRLLERVYVYVDEGKGVRPEDGVGSYAHEVKLPKLYDAQENKQGLWKGSDLNATESAILDAGYGGYYVRDIGNNQGAAVVLGEASRDLKVKQLPDYIKGAAPAPAPATEASKALMSKEIAKLDVSRIPGARIKSGTLTVPLDSIAEANEEMVRIDSEIRFSKTRESEEDFVESAIVDNDGNLVTLYHGTAGIGDKAIEEFRLGHGLYGAGIYLTEYPSRAEAYAIGDRGHMYPVKVSITNPYDADDFLDRYGKGTKSKQRANEIREELIAEGYDGIVDRSMNKFWEVIAFHPEQIKFALEIPAADIQRSRTREGLKPEIVETAGQVLRYLTPAERVKLRRDTAQTLVDTFKQLPSGNEMAAVAFAGKAKRGWYHNSARAIEHVFGHDAPRFAALLAAMSPQTSVEVNLRNALNTWKNWIAAERPTSRGAIFEIMGRSVEGNRLTDSVLPAWVPNSVRALTAEDPTQITLSGPKVNSFMLNLRGVVEEVTNDAWMANYAAVDQRIFSGSLNAAGTDPGKGPGYMAMSAKAREAARKLTQLTGDEWTPAEVQETVWSWAKTLYELQSKDVGARELLDNKAVTDDLIASTPDFSSQLHEAKNEETLKRAGYGDQLGSLRSRADLAAARDKESTTSEQTGPFDPETQDRLERRAASRLEQLRDDRAAAEAVTREENAQRSTAREEEPLPGAPRVAGATGPDQGIVDVANAYAAQAGVDLKRQTEYVKVDEALAKRIADAYEAMEHAPQDPKVKAAYADLIAQTRAQYDALSKAGYTFTFYTGATDPYAGNPWNAIRDLRANKRMAVYGTYDGYGTEGITMGATEGNPMLATTGLRWKDQAGAEHDVTANDLFRAVHDAFGHGLEGAGFRAQGEENAWQAHVRLFTGPAVGAITSETRGQNSWLNYGPHGERNRTAKIEDTVFADQKTGLMPEWTWTEGRAGDAQRSTERDMFPEDFAKKTDTVPTAKKISSSGETAVGVNVNSNGAQISSTKQGLKNFWSWFGYSDAVDEKGRPQVYYHTTRNDFGKFEAGRTTKNSSTFGEWDTTRAATFFTDDKDASQEYAKIDGEFRNGANVMQVYLRATNPLDMVSGYYGQAESIDREFEEAGLNPRWLHQFDWSKFDDEDGKAFVAAAKKLGYDSVIFWDEIPGDDGAIKSFKTTAIFDSEQVKSATGNRGTFDSGSDITRSTAREDAFAPDQIEQLLDKDDWAIMTAENPAAKQYSAADNASAMDALRADLRTAGARFQEVRGKYGNEENSLAITGIDEAQAIALGKKYGQESVLTRKGLVYQDGSITPATGITKYATAPDDFYSKIGDTIFSIGLDFDVRVTPQDVNLSKARDDQYEGHLNDGSSVQKHSAGGLYPYVVVARDAKDGDGYEYGLIGPDTDGYVWIGSWEKTTDSAIDRKVARELRNSPRSNGSEYTDKQRAIAAKLGYNLDLPRGTVLEPSQEELKLDADISEASTEANWAWGQAKKRIVQEMMAEFREKAKNANVDFDDDMLKSLATQMFYSRRNNDRYEVEFSEYNALSAKVDKLREQQRDLISKRVGPPEFDSMQQLDDFQRPITETENFKKWFDGSKVVTKDGQPLIAFHGTNQDFTEFRTLQKDAKQRSGDNWLGQIGTWFAAPSESNEYDVGNAEYTAEAFSEHRNRSDSDVAEGAVVYPVFLSIKNPYETEGYENIIEDREEAGGGAALRKQLISEGYDGIVIRESNTDGGQYRDDWVAFYPTQIKSALGNNGDFSATDGDITRSKNREPIFYSQLELALEGVPDRLATMAAPQWKLWLDANAPKFGVKKEEIEWSGIKDYLSMRGKDKVTKDELAQYMRDSGVKVGETMLGEDEKLTSAGREMAESHGHVWTGLSDVDRRRYVRVANGNRVNEDLAGTPKYAQYTVPGGENYREILITLPPKKQSIEGWTAERFGESTGADYEGWNVNGRLADGMRFRSEIGIDTAATEAEAIAEAQRVAAKHEITDAGDTYNSGHWDQPNVLAHIRVDDRVDADGKRTLFINEIQSDFGQDHRRQRVAIENSVDDDFDGIVKRMQADGVLEVECD